jgi:hypothetical protein
MNKPTPEQIAKLPKWAQQVFRERDEAIRALAEYRDEQTPSPFYQDYQGTTHTEKRFIQAREVVADFEGVRVRVTCFNSGQHGPGIRLQWEDSKRHGKEVALIPVSYQYARLVAKADMA